MLITGNTITGSISVPRLGIGVQLPGTGDTLQHSTIANNNIVLLRPGGSGISFNAGVGIGQTKNQVLDTLIANNSISVPQGAIKLLLGGNSSNLGNVGNGGGPAGGDGGSGNLIDGMQLIANQIRITGDGGTGIALTLGDTPSDGFQLPVIQYAEKNIARNVGILANTIEGPAGPGISVYAGSGTVRNDAIANLSILGNTLTGVTRAGMALSVASSFGSPAPSTGNTLSNVLVQANTIQSSVLPIDPSLSGYYTVEQAINSAGIAVLAGSRAQGNSVNGISIANNHVDTPSIGIAITGGAGAGTPYSGPPFPADNNVVSIYLWHVPWLNSVLQMHFLRSNIMRLVFFFVGSVLLGILTAKLVEFPALRLRERLFPPSAPRQTLEPALAQPLSSGKDEWSERRAPNPTIML